MLKASFVVIDFSCYAIQHARHSAATSARVQQPVFNLLSRVAAASKMGKKRFYTTVEAS